MAQQLKVFVSHSHEDDAFCHELVDALRKAGADVWYDEHNLGSGQLMEVIQRELGLRPVFVVILSKAAFASRWVKRETTWAFELFDRDHTRILVPVTAGAIERSDFSAENGWLFLHDFIRIEAPGYQPFPRDEAVRRTLRALALASADEASDPMAPHPADRADELIGRGKALQAQGKHTEALVLFERATELAPMSVDAWVTLGAAMNELKRWDEALPVHERAIALDSTSAVAWYNKGWALVNLKRYYEALTTFDRAVALDPDNDDVSNAAHFYDDIMEDIMEDVRELDYEA